MSPNRVKDLVPWVVTIAAMAAAGSGQLSAFAPAPRQARGDDGLGLSRKHAYFLSLAESFARVRDRFPPTPPFRLLPCAEEVALSNGLLDAETAYWDLYAAYGRLHAAEQGLLQVTDAWAYTSGSEAMLAQVRAQYELFCGNRREALAELWECERRLRRLLGLPTADGKLLVTADAPDLTPLRPEWGATLREALTRRPELIPQRVEVIAAWVEYCLGQSGKLSATAVDRNRRVDGTPFQWNWRKPPGIPRPPGYPLARVERAHETLHDQEEKIEHYLVATYGRLITTYDLFGVRQAQREAFAEQLRARQQDFLIGNGALDSLLEAQRFAASALADEYSAIREYNKARAAFAFARGALIERNGVRSGGRFLSVAEERERTLERVRKEKPLVVDDFPSPDAVSAPTLVVLWKAVPPLREVKPLPGPDEPDSSGPRLESYGEDDLFPPEARPTPKRAGAGK